MDLENLELRIRHCKPSAGFLFGEEVQKEHKLTREFLVESALSEKALKEFDTHFQSGTATIQTILRKCEELNLFTLPFNLIVCLPKNPEPLILDEYPGGNLYYNGDIHIKKGFECSGNIVCKKLIVNGEFKISEDYHAHADIEAKSVSMNKNAYIGGAVYTETLLMDDNASIHYTVKAKNLIMYKNALIDACAKVKNLIMSDDAQINADVEAETSSMKKNASVGGGIISKTHIMFDNTFVCKEVKTRILIMWGLACISGRVATNFISMHDQAQVFEGFTTLQST